MDGLTGIIGIITPRNHHWIRQIHLQIVYSKFLDYDLIPDLFHFDDYDKCLFYTSHNDPTYCSLTIQLLPENTRNVSDSINRAWTTIQKNTESASYLYLPQCRMIVSTFLVISSWLLSVQFFKKLKSEGRIRFRYVLQSIIKRFTSGLTVIILHTSWLNHLFRGPFAESILGVESNVCRKKWWTNLLYINNFVMSDGVCLLHTWYLSVDFQLTILGVFLLWLTQKQPKYLLLTSGCVIAFQIIFMFVYLALNNFKFAVIFTPELTYYFKFIFLKEWQATWTSTYSNLAPFAFGLCFGYLYIRHEKQKYSKIYINLWRMLTTLLIVGTPFLSTYLMTTTMYRNRWFNAAYGSIDKILFDLGIALFIFGLSQNLGGIVKKGFEWSPMHTLGQLSFGAYLIHLSILETDASLRRTPHYFLDFLAVSVIRARFHRSGNIDFEMAMLMMNVNGFARANLTSYTKKLGIADG
ncbi:O-acyltransferase like protein-like [Zophobas morio]|uniref:O-acyltransferase like protein-like n=1 Tax=Zophobas morio TaxID=2755281 RepID=UPI0030830C20